MRGRGGWGGVEEPEGLFSLSIFSGGISLLKLSCCTKWVNFNIYLHYINSKEKKRKIKTFTLFNRIKDPEDFGFFFVVTFGTGEEEEEKIEEVGGEGEIVEEELEEEAGGRVTEGTVLLSRRGWEGERGRMAPDLWGEEERKRERRKRKCKSKIKIKINKIKNLHKPQRK